MLVYLLCVIVSVLQQSSLLLRYSHFDHRLAVMCTTGLIWRVEWFDWYGKYLSLPECEKG